MSEGVIIGCARAYFSYEFVDGYQWTVRCRHTGILLDEVTEGPYWPAVRDMMAAIHGVDGAIIDREIDLAWGLQDDFRIADDDFWNRSFKLWRDSWNCGWAQVIERYTTQVSDRQISVAEHKALIAEAMAPFVEYAARDDAKKQAIKARRSSFSSARPNLLLAILDRGDPHMCASEGCIETADLTIDHIVPLSRGGTDDLDNLRLLCRGCNSRKGNRVLEMGVGA